MLDLKVHFSASLIAGLKAKVLTYRLAKVEVYTKDRAIYIFRIGSPTSY